MVFSTGKWEFVWTLYKSLALVPNQITGKETDRIDLSTWNLQTFETFGLMRLKNMHFSGVFCTFSPRYAMFRSTGITLPFWCESKKCTDLNLSCCLLSSTLIPFWEPQILSCENKSDLAEQFSLDLLLTLSLSPDPLKHFCLGLLNWIE